MSRNASLRTAVVSIVIAVFIAAAAIAKQEQVMTRGFDRDKPFQVNDVDSIDLLSGNLILSVPLGGEYRSNGTLKYSFALTYNSHIWDYQHIESGSLGRYIALEYNELVDNVDKITDGDLPPNVNGVESYPAPVFNAGLGWMVSLGELRDGYTYVAPDGSSHRFYRKLTGDVYAQDAFNAAIGTKLYTRDGSYLRMTKVSATERLIEFPDGIHKIFTCTMSNTADCDKQPSPVWMLDEISDPFGNLLYVTRSPQNRPTAGGSTWTWTFTEVSKSVPPSDSDVATYIRKNESSPTNVVRMHTFTYLIPSGKTYETRLTSAAVAAKGGPANYTFTYKDRDLYRDRGSTWGGSGLKVPFNSANKVNISTLLQITLPLGAGSWFFSYTETAADDPDLGTVIWNPNMTFRTSKQDGHLRSVTLPTGGRVEYDYEGRNIPARRCEMKHQGVAQFSPLGVSKRRVFAAGKSTASGEWSYYASRYKSAEPTSPTTCNQVKEFVITTIGPPIKNPPPGSSEHRTVTVSFFSAYRDDNDDKGKREWKKEEHGLPFTKEVSDGSGRFLSELTYSCAGDAFDGGAIDAMRRLIDHRRTTGETSPCGVPMRIKYVRYDHSGLDCSDEGALCLASQTRMASSREVYPAQNGGDVETYLDTSNSDFDGLGHYRTVTTGGNLFKTIFPGIAGSDERITSTNYNPGVVYNASNYSVTPFPGRWLLGTYDRVDLKERRNGNLNAAFNIASSEYEFLANTGWLRRARRFSSTTGTRSSNDVVTTFERSNVSDFLVKTIERSYGGDSVSQNQLQDQSLPALTLPGKPEYVIERRSQHGSPQLVQYVGCNLDEVIYLVENNAVDAASGLITSSTAQTGAVSSYDYDVLGRITTFTPQGEASTSYQYTPAGGTSGPKVTVTRSNATDTLSESITADGFGRVALRKSRIPDDADGFSCNNCWNSQETTYFVDGQVATSSVVRGENKDPGWRVTWFYYDALGRKVLVQTPDGSKTTYAYYGMWHVAESVPTLGIRDSFYDRHGRLIKLTQGSGMPFRYEYDSSGRLSQTVAIQGSDSNRSFFTYDNRGFLIREFHPEIGPTGIKYEYDSRGNPISKLHPNEPTTYALTMLYDGAERLTDVIRGDKTIKHFAFHPTGVPMAVGQLALAQRLNIVPKPGITQLDAEYSIITQYAYHPSTGRLASTAVSSSNDFSAKTSYTWNSLGQLTTLRYPDLCPAGNCSRVVTQTYKNGFLRGVEGFASPITYFPNGMTRKVAHANTTHDETFLADHEMPRPARIEFLRSNTLVTYERFGSPEDPIVYNDAGNITRIARLGGADTFGYDNLGRLTAATVNARNQTYGYDSYGNLTSIATDGASRNLAVKGSQNNQLASADYDHAGHLLTMPDPRQGASATAKYTFLWDSQGMMKYHSATDIGRVFLYDAFDERVATIDYTASPMKELWTVRDQGNRVLSDFERIGTGAFTRKRDYIHRGSTVLAVVEGDQVQHLHTDHLGTPRLVTNLAGTVALHRDYFPFGEELVERDQPDRLEFTGHERDSDGTLAAGSDIDYMHARYYVPALGRFLSVDPIKHKSTSPQFWNRYAYALNNPNQFVDPDGLAGRVFIYTLAPEQWTPSGAYVSQVAMTTGRSVQTRVVPPTEAGKSAMLEEIHSTVGKEDILMIYGHSGAAGPGGGGYGVGSTSDLHKAAGATPTINGDELATAIAGTSASLVLLNGCNTFDMGTRIARGVGTTTVTFSNYTNSTQTPAAALTMMLAFTTGANLQGAAAFASRNLTSAYPWSAPPDVLVSTSVTPNACIANGSCGAVTNNGQQ
ncbi:MAG TPA: RHS repeat-associated core domain-containing protein [Thermoanaerobaculia bacterium]|nr:RHS repeat-associated core domain-containing protein [Thermoanaerobaculia bacterium]